MSDVNSEFLLLCLVGPSGVGKSTLAQKLLQEFPELSLSISYTTRNPRGKEVNGKDYHFISIPEFIIMTDHFVEWAQVHDHWYGTNKNQIELAQTTHQGMIFDIDWQGANAIKTTLKNVSVVFILPPSLKELETRLRERKTDSEEIIIKRMRRAIGEIEHHTIADHIIINNNLDHAYDELRSIVIHHKSKQKDRTEFAKKLMSEY